MASEKWRIALHQIDSLLADDIPMAAMPRRAPVSISPQVIAAAARPVRGLLGCVPNGALGGPSLQDRWHNEVERAAWFGEAMN